MRSTQVPTRPDDPTSRVRIRDAAVLLFGRVGYDGTTLRSIARETGVSAGLVIHHFGSKEQLRDACDEHIVESILGRKEGSTGSDMTATMQRWLDDGESAGIMTESNDQRMRAVPVAARRALQLRHPDSPSTSAG